MKTYYEYTQKERSEMTEENVSALLDAQLMQEGVLKPEPPVLEDVKTPDMGKRKMFWRPSCRNKYGSHTHIEIAFSSAEDASAFIALKPVISDYDYQIGSEYPYGRGIDDAKIECVELFDENVILKFKSDLTRIKAATERNEKLKSDFNAKFGAAEKVFSGVWSDWQECRYKAQEHSRVTKTWSEYLTMSDNDQSKALAFFRKIYNDETISAAFAWFDVPSPLITAGKTA